MLPEILGHWRLIFSRSSLRRRHTWATGLWICVCCSLAAAVTSGCRSEAQIETYEAPKEPRSAGLSSGEFENPTHRMLAAILPVGDMNWFFKATGTVDDMNAREDQILEFFAGLDISADATQATWTVPAGWETQPGTEMREATLIIPADDEPIEMSVTRLPRSTEPAANLLGNLNRWRNQMSLPPVLLAGLERDTREMSAQGGAITLVDLRGIIPDSNAAAPAAAVAQGTMPPDHPPIAAGAGSTAPSQPPPAGPVVMQVPESWQSRPPTSMRQLNYLLTDGDASAEMYVSGFPTTAGPMITNPLENINRWRGEVGLARIEEAELGSHISPIEVDGQQGILVHMTAPEGTPSGEATLGAMVTHGAQIWFFKLKGDVSLVEREAESFRAAVESALFQE